MRFYLLVLTLLLLLASASCSSEPQTLPTPIVVLPSATAVTDQSTSVATTLPPSATAPEATPLPATSPATATSPLTATLFPPTITATTAAPTLPPVPHGIDQRLEFTAGTISTSVEQSVVRGTQDRYILWAQAGQTMQISLSSLENNAVATVYGPDGTLLAQNVSDRWQDQLPLSGDYQIEIAPTRGNASYRLAVTIPPEVNATPSRIQFAPGAIAATISGSLETGGDLDAYILGAAAGQTITVEVAPAASPLFVYLHDANEQYLAAAENGRLQTVLPGTQDYLLTVASPNAAGSLTYSLTITIQ